MTSVSTPQRIDTYDPNNWILVMNEDLVRTAKDRKWKPGLLTQFGRELGDTSGNDKPMHVYYPRSQYTKEDVERIAFVDKKYDNCEVCKHGRNVEKTSNFININNNNNSNKADSFFNRSKNMIGSIKGRMKKMASDTTRPYVGQGIAALTRMGADTFLNTAGDKLIFGISGLIGNIINETRLRNKTAREVFNSWMWNALPTTAVQAEDFKRNLGMAGSNVRARKYGSAFGSLLEEPHRVMGAFKFSPGVSKFANSLKSFGNKISSKFSGSAGKQYAPLISSTPKAQEVAPVRSFYRDDSVTY